MKNVHLLFTLIAKRLKCAMDVFKGSKNVSKNPKFFISKPYIFTCIKVNPKYLQ